MLLKLNIYIYIYVESPPCIPRLKVLRYCATSEVYLRGWRQQMLSGQGQCDIDYFATSNILSSRNGVHKSKRFRRRSTDPCII